MIDIKKVSDLELGKLLAEQQAQHFQIQKNIDALAKEMELRLLKVEEDKKKEGKKEGV